MARSVLASEIQALLLGLDCAFVFRDRLEELIGINVVVEAYVDSKKTIDIVAKEEHTREYRLQIDLFAIRKSYEQREL